MARTLKAQLDKRRSALKMERASFIPHWQDLSDWIAPRRGRFVTSDRNKGDKRNRKIINSAGTIAQRTLASGMMAGITSPARPWFRLATPDPAMRDLAPVKVWLATVEGLMRDIFAASNLYNVLPTLYKELGTMGTGCMSVVEDFEDVIRCTPFTVGSYMIANNERLTVNTMYREFQMTVSQLMAKKEREGWRLSNAVQNLWDRGDAEEWIDVVHVVERNDDRDIRRHDFRGKPFRSVYYEPNGDGDVLASLKGFDEFPILAPRWEVTGEDVYGTDCPGMIALGDIKQLQLEEKRKAQAIDKNVNPPLHGPASLMHKEISSLPGGITIYDSGADGRHTLRPVYEVQPRINELMLDIQSVEHRIDRAYFADLFLMLAQSDRRQITAREIEERHEEKLLMLGPVLERLHDELLDPLIDRTFAIMLRAGILPEPPAELQGVELKVEYISLLAQAQKAVGVSGIDDMTSYVAQVSALEPSARHKWDFLGAIDARAEMLGVPPQLVRPDDTVRQIADAEAQQMAAQQALAAAGPMADAVKTASETDTDGKNMLTDLIAGSA